MHGDQNPEDYSWGAGAKSIHSPHGHNVSIQVDPYDGAVNRKPEFKNGAPAGGEIRPEIIKEFGGAARMNAKERALEYGMLLKKNAKQIYDWETKKTYHHKNIIIWDT